MANLVLKKCRACGKKQNVSKETGNCYVCGSVLDVATEAPVKKTKIKKRQLRQRRQTDIAYESHARK